MNTASKQQLENEFGTSNEDEIVKKILTSGEVQSSEVCTRHLLTVIVTPDWKIANNVLRTPSVAVAPTTPRAPWPTTKLVALLLPLDSS